MDDERAELKITIVYYLARNGVTGGHNKTVDTVKNRAGIAVHEHGEAEAVIRELIRDPDAPASREGRDSLAVLGRKLLFAVPARSCLHRIEFLSRLVCWMGCQQYHNIPKEGEKEVSDLVA